MEASTTVNQSVNQPADVSFETYTADSGLLFAIYSNRILGRSHLGGYIRLILNYTPYKEYQSLAKCYYSYKIFISSLSFCT